MLLDEPSLDGFLQMREALVPKAQIHTGVERERSRGDLVAGDTGQPVDGEAVRHDEAVELPALPEEFGEEGAVARAGHAVDLVVRGHDGGGPGTDPGAGGREMDLVQFPQPQLGLGGVTAADGGALSGEVLEHDGGLVAGEELPRALHAAYQRLREPGGQVRVFAEALLRTSPARVAGDVQCRDQGDVAATGPQFGGGVGGGTFVELGVPGGADGQIDREDRAVEGHEAVRDLLDEQCGDTEPAPLDDMPLHQFGQGGAVFRPGPAAVVDAGPGIGALESVEGAEPLEAVGLGVQRVGEFEVAAGVRR